MAAVFSLLMFNSRSKQEEARKIEMRKIKGKGRKIKVEVTEVAVDSMNETTPQISVKREPTKAAKSTFTLLSLIHLLTKRKAVKLPLETPEALHNDHDNPFCNLPALVIDRIAGFIDSTSDIWAMSHTCRHLYQALRLSCYEQLCILEENAKLPRNERTGSGKTLRKELAVCSECQAAHKRKCFSVQQLARVSYLRQCWGSEGLLQIFEHEAIGFKDIKQKARGIKDRLFYVEEDWTAHQKFRDTWQREDRNGLIMQKKEGSVEVCRALILIERAESEPFNADEVNAALWSKPHIKLCPHLHASSIEVSMNFREQLCISNGCHWIFGRIVKRTWWTCYSCVCYTRFRMVEQRHEPGRKRLVLDIRRDVGTLRRVTDERWRAQLVSRETVELEQRRGW